MKFLLAAVLLATCLVVQSKHVDIDFDKVYNALRVKNVGRIISGQEAHLKQFPFQAALLMTPIGGSKPNNLCGGTLISERYILTAAHCVHGFQSWIVKLGGVRLDRPEETQIVTLSKKAIKHEKYDPIWVHNDIALVELPFAVNFNEYIQPLRLPARSEINLDLNNKIVRVSGWGRTSDSSPDSSPALMFVDVKVITNNECREFFEGSILPSSICTKGFPEHSGCQGDSGGPLTRVAEDGKVTHVGLVSFGSNAGCSLGYPAVYTRTSSYLDWIHQHTNIAIRA